MLVSLSESVAAFHRADPQAFRCSSPQGVNYATLANLSSGNSLRVGYTIASLDCKYRLILQPDRNLVFYYTVSGYVPFSSGTGGNEAVHQLTLRDDGNLVLEASTGIVFWQSGKTDTDHGPYVLAVQNDGNFVVYGRNNYVVWALNLDSGQWVGVNGRLGAFVLRYRRWGAIADIAGNARC